MTEFFETASRFPAAVFGVMLVVVIVYWIIVFLGAFGIDVLDGGDGDGIGPAGVLASIGLGGVPVAVTMSLWIAFAWFATFVGTAVLGDADSGGIWVVLGVGILLGATVAAYIVTLVLVLPMRRLFPDVEPAARVDFVGSICVVRTSEVSQSYGQAEVRAADGSSAIIQVRQSGEDDIRAGTKALIVEYDEAEEIFWIMKYADADPQSLTP